MSKNVVISIIVFILVVAGMVWLIRTPGKPGKLDSFAQCLADSGTKYYGAFWCPNCKTQEALFGRSAKHIPYIECSTPDGRGQKPVCGEAGVEGYPTWDFPDGTRVTGTQSLETLQEKTGCLLPEDEGLTQ